MSDDRAPQRVVFVGWGAIARTTASMLSDLSEIVAVAVRDAAVLRADLPTSATLVSDPQELAGFAPDVVAEAAGIASVEPWSRAAIDAGADVIVSSVAAFADSELLEALAGRAARAGTQLVIQPGALAGVEALSAAKLMGIAEVEHRIVKPPAAWRGTEAEGMCDLDELSEPTSFFHGAASEAASRFPKNANVAMTTALAGIGPHRTQITLVADPAASTNRHELRAVGAFGVLDVQIANNPLPTNPKTSSLAALSLARAIEQRMTAIAI